MWVGLGLVLDGSIKITQHKSDLLVSKYVTFKAPRIAVYGAGLNHNTGQTRFRRYPQVPIYICMPPRFSLSFFLLPPLSTSNFSSSNIFCPQLSKAKGYILYSNIQVILLQIHASA